MSANRLKLNMDKTELLCVGSRHSLSQLLSTCLPVLHLGPDSIEARDHVRLLGVTLSSDLSLDRHANIVSTTSFYWLRQLRRSRRSLDTDSTTTLVHAAVKHGLMVFNCLHNQAPRYLFSRVTLISKLPSTSDLTVFMRLRDLPCLQVKSHDYPINDCRVDSAVLYLFIYIDSKPFVLGTVSSY